MPEAGVPTSRQQTSLACHASLRLGAGGFCQLAVSSQNIQTNDDVFPRLPDILCAYWDPAAGSAESGWSIAERRAGEFIASGQREHLHIKHRIRPMLGFKRFETAAVTIRGIELAEKIKKHQFNFNH